MVQKCMFSSKLYNFYGIFLHLSWTQNRLTRKLFIVSLELNLPITITSSEERRIDTSWSKVRLFLYIIGNIDFCKILFAIQITEHANDERRYTSRF